MMSRALVHGDVKRLDQGQVKRGSPRLNGHQCIAGMRQKALNQRVPPYPCGIVQEIDREKGKEEAESQKELFASFEDKLPPEMEAQRKALLTRLAEAPERLVALANERGGDDNITVIVIKVDGGLKA